MREEEPSPNASLPLEELRSSPPPRRGKRSCSLASHRRASWLPMREPRELLPSLFQFDKEGNRWKERTDGTVKFPKNKVTSRIYAVSITIRIVVGFMLLTCIWEFNFPPFMVLVIAILNDGEMKQLMCFLRSIYDLARLEDEVDFLTAQSEQDRQKRNNVKFWDAFRSKEIKLAFLVGGGLLVKKFTNVSETIMYDLKEGSLRGLEEGGTAKDLGFKLYCFCIFL
ncbi:hypothetical protein HN873_040084 [Arachis hypogaea]